jgi:hypothetical protein
VPTVILLVALAATAIIMTVPVAPIVIPLAVAIVVSWVAIPLLHPRLRMRPVVRRGRRAVVVAWRRLIVITGLRRYIIAVIAVIIR